MTDTVLVKSPETAKVELPSNMGAVAFRRARKRGAGFSKSIFPNFMTMRFPTDRTEETNKA